MEQYLPGYPKYTSAKEVIQQKANNKNNAFVVQAQIVNQPLPLDANGFLNLSAIQDPVNNQYLTIAFKQFNAVDFSNYPFIL